MGYFCQCYQILFIHYYLCYDKIRYYQIIFFIFHGFLYWLIHPHYFWKTNFFTFLYYFDHWIFILFVILELLYQICFFICFVNECLVEYSFSSLVFQFYCYIYVNLRIMILSKYSIYFWSLMLIRFLNLCFCVVTLDFSNYFLNFDHNRCHNYKNSFFKILKFYYFCFL